MNRIAYILSALLLTILTASCEKELDFEYHDVDSPLVIEASLSQNGSSVSITRTVAMDEPMDPDPVTAATVRLTDVTDGTSRILTLRADGTFGDEVPGVPGHTYSVDVDHQGTVYCSTCAMRTPTEIVSMEFSWIKMPYDEVAVLQVSFRADPSDPDDCYWVRLLRNGEAYQWMVIDGHNAADGVINAVTMTTRKTIEDEEDKDLLLDGDEVTALVTPISREMSDYLTALSANSNGPAMWSGGFCLGYFLAAPVAERTIVFHPDLIE